MENLNLQRYYVNNVEELIARMMQSLLNYSVDLLKFYVKC